MKYQMRKDINGQVEEFHKWTIREMAEDDEQILQLILKNVPVFMDKIIDPDFANGSIEKYINNIKAGRLGDFSKRYIIFAYDGETPVGAIISLPRDNEKGYHILTVGVKEEYRKRGVGSALISTCINHMYKNKVSELILDVYEKNTPAVALYEKFGFQWLK